MNRLSFPIIVLVFLTAKGSSLAQTPYPVPAGAQACIEGAAPGRPTLKRRQPTPDTPAVEGSSVDQSSLQREKCKEAEAAAPPRHQEPIHVKFEGLHAFSETEIVKAFCEQRIVLSKTDLPASEVLTKAIAVIKELLDSRGHLQAVVDTRQDVAARNITFLVYEGPRFPLAEIRFEGNRIFLSQVLASRMGECVAKYEQTQRGYDSDVFDYCLRGLTDFIRSRGYLQARLGQPAKEIDGRGLIVTTPVEEGVLYRLGEIRIVGAEVLSPEQIRAMFGFRQGDAASAGAIGKWLFEDLKKAYGEMGYIQYTAEPTPDFKTAAKGANEGVVDLNVTIEEGRQFRVKAIRFQGNDASEKELLGRVRLRAGDVYNQRLFEESIDELNKLGRFELIDKDRDADFRTDEERGLVEIVIKADRLKHQQPAPPT